MKYKIHCEACRGLGRVKHLVWDEEAQNWVTSAHFSECTPCHGTGEACGTCKGTGLHHTSCQTIMDIPYDCPSCDKGTRRVNPGQVLPSAADSTCHHCSGTGRL
jgi:hypothetical protein